MTLRRSLHNLLLLTFLLISACAQNGGSGSSTSNGQNSSGDNGGGGSHPDPVNTSCGTMIELECQVLDIVNDERVKSGLSQLAANSKCIAEAQSHAQDMVANNYFAHDGLTETTSQRFARFGLNGAAWGENIAAGYGTPAAVMTGWMNSAGHRANILSTQFKSMGVGLATKADGTKYWVQCFSGFVK